MTSWPERSIVYFLVPWLTPQVLWGKKTNKNIIHTILTFSSNVCLYPTAGDGILKLYNTSAERFFGKCWRSSIGNQAWGELLQAPTEANTTCPTLQQTIQKLPCSLMGSRPSIHSETGKSVPFLTGKHPPHSLAAVSHLFRLPVSQWTLMGC